MRELVLTHITEPNSGIAFIALVDYDSYTADVKQISFTGNYKKSKEIGEILKSGKLRPYRNNLESKKDAWLAHDAERGCLIVRYNGSNTVFPTDEYVYQNSTLLTNKNGYYVETANEYNPRRFGLAEDIKSFWNVLSAIQDKYDKPLSDANVRKELAKVTGVGISFSSSKDWNDEVTHEEYEVFLNGLTIDKLKIEKKLKSINIKFHDGVCDILEVDGIAEIRVYKGEDGIVKNVLVHKSICGARFGFDCEKCPNLIPASPDCKLNHIEGYNRSNVDLTMFPNLRDFTKCWNFTEGNNLGRIDIKLPGAPETSFDNSFHNVAVKGLYPYMDVVGNLNFTGVKTIKNSFSRFSGPVFITGYVDRIEGSFLSSDFNGTFDIDLQWVSHSFGYYRKKRIRSIYGGYHNNDDKNKQEIYFPEGTVRIHLQQQMHPQIKNEPVAATFSMGGAPYEVDYTPWKQKQILDYAVAGSKISKLTIDTDPNIAFIINSSVNETIVNGNCTQPMPVFNGGVFMLIKGNYIYPNVENIGAKCFAEVTFPDTHICELQEGTLRFIGDRAFYSSKGISYLVIPKSCYQIGTAAFSEMTDGRGNLTTICVYRNSYGHDWSKGKKLKILIIDGIDDIPKPTSAESETDFIAEFVETPSWAKKSKPFVAKLLYAGTVDLLHYIPVVAQLPDEAVQFFTEQLASYDGVIKRYDSTECRRDIEADECLIELKDGFISRSALKAAALNAVYGSRIDLLNPVILKQFVWEPFHAFEVTRWNGTPKVRGADNGIGTLTVYVRGNDLLYVGCGSICPEDSKEKTPWATPREIISSDNLIGSEVEGRLVISSDWGSSVNIFKVHGDILAGEAATKLNDFIYKGMVLLSSQLAGKSGRKSVTENFVYDIVNGKIYKFSSVSNKYNSDGLGAYCGEVPISEFADISNIKKYEDACVAVKQYSIKHAEKAAPCFEVEYCRTHKPFNLYGNDPQLNSFIEFLSRSGLVKRITESNFNERVISTQKLRLKDGTIIEQGKTFSGQTFLLQIYDDKFHGFEAGFDMLKFTELMDKRINGLSKYEFPERGYFNITKKDDIFEVLPRKGKDSEDGTVLAIDLLSGKLVLVRYDSNEVGIICSFNSAKDARDFYTEYGCRIFAVPNQTFINAFESAVYISYKNGNRVLDIHPYQGDERVKNSLLMLGGHTPQKEYKPDKDIYDSTILTYCRI